MGKKKARRSSRKRTRTLAQVEERQIRYEKALATWTAKLQLAATKVQHYQKQLKYYNARVLVVREQDFERRLDTVQPRRPGDNHRDIDLE